MDFTDYNALQPYFNAYRTLALQYGFEADEGDALLASDPRFQNWVLTGALPVHTSAVVAISSSSPTTPQASTPGNGGLAAITGDPSDAVGTISASLGGFQPMMQPPAAAPSSPAMVASSGLPAWMLPLAIVALVLYALKG